MKILILSDNFPPERDGGAERIAYNYFTGLKNLGHDVFVFTSTCHPREGEDPVGSYSNKNIYKIYTPKHYSKFNHFLGLYNPYSAKYFKKILGEIKPDIVHAHNIHDILGLNLLKIAKKSGAKIFITTHDSLLFHYGKLTEFIPQIDKNKINQEFDYKVNNWQLLKRYKKKFVPLRQTIIKHYLKYVDKIFAVSLELKKALEQNNIKNIEIIYNGIDPVIWQASGEKINDFKNKYNLKNNPKIIFWGGRLSTLKGGGLLLNALELVVKQNPNFILMIVGKKDSEAEKFLKIAEEKKIPVIFTGWLTQKEIAVAYHASDFMIVPSAYLDPFPTINLEAGACAKPVIGTCLGGTKEIIIDNETGYIINPYNQEMFTEKILALLNNPKLTQKFGQAGFELVTNKFSLDQQLKETLKYYY